MINEFTGKYRFLSNFYMCGVEFEGKVYKSSEHAFVAAKTLDHGLRAGINALATPADAKKFGRTISLRPDWDTFKFEAMYLILQSKFTRNPELKQKLLDTGYEELVEGNHWGDKIWGVDLRTNFGQNHLGLLLMKVRDQLRQEVTHVPHPSTL